MVENLRGAEHAAVDELLPWYVNETLSRDEYTRVRRHLDRCADCRENVSLLSRVSSVVGRPTATPIVPPPRSEGLLRNIERLEGVRPGRWSRPSLATAASLAAAAAAFLLLWPNREAGVPDTPLYETATSAPQAGGMAYVMSLEFEPGVGTQDRQRLFRDLDAGDIRRDEASGAYHVSITLAATSVEELARFTDALEARPEVRTARVVALQLPMRREPATERR